MTAPAARGPAPHACSAGSSITKRAPSVAVPPVLHPHPPAVKAHVFVDEGQAQPSALAGTPPPGRDTAGEPLEDEDALVRRDAGAMVLHGDLDVGHLLSCGLGRLHGDGDLAPSVVPGVLEEVRHHPGEAALVGLDHQVLGPGIHLQVRIGERAHAHGLAHELGHQQVLTVKPDGAGVEAGDLEQVLDQPLEAPDVGHDEVDGGGRLVGQLLPPALQDLGRRGQRREGGTELVAHVRREPGIALDPLLERRRHVVERPGQHLEVRVVARLQPGAETRRRRSPVPPARRRPAAGPPAGRRRYRAGHRAPS